jgi:L-fuculose-phosphate aldolase
MPQTILKTKHEIIKVGRLLYQQSYIVATDGNISVRLDSDTMLITRSGVSKGELTFQDIIKLPLDITEAEVKSMKIKPSTEYRMHQIIYRERSNIKAVIHAHPLYLTCLTVTMQLLDTKLLLETEESFGKISYLDRLAPGSSELAEAVRKVVNEHDIMVLSHHGVVVLGRDLSEARYRLERLEFLAKVMVISKLF